ncbi:MAG: LacI family DNA-binding transcriptional regulator [Bacillota bacterium]
MSRVTIKDVSRAAGVAPSTVSRAMTGRGYVSEATREKVLRTIKELNFQPSSAARTLISGRTGTIALVLPDITNPFFPLLARGVEDAARAQGYMVLLCNTDGDHLQEQSYSKLLLEQRVDGVVLSAGSTKNRELWTRLAERLPLVVMDRRMEGAAVDVVLTDNAAGAREATAHLIRLGHRRIGHISGPPDLPTSQDRRLGYEQALRAAGLPVDPCLVKAGDFRYGSGYNRMRELLDHGVTAVFAANDMMAIGAMKAIQETGARVPDDVAIVGFDDIEMASMVAPAMTTINQAAYRMGVMAVDMLFQRIAGEAPRKPQQKVLRPSLVIRESTGKKGDQA